MKKPIVMKAHDCEAVMSLNLVPPTYDLDRDCNIPDLDDGLEELLRLKAMAEAGHGTEITGMSREERRRALWGENAAPVLPPLVRHPREIIVSMTDREFVRWHGARHRHEYKKERGWRAEDRAAKRKARKNAELLREDDQA